MDYSTCSPPGPACNSISALLKQSDAFNTATPPPLPVTIVGTGFGYPQQTLPFAVQSSKLLDIQDNGVGSKVGWSTGDGGGGASCQMYIANWTDTRTSLVANTPIDAASLDAQALSPLSDVSPLTFFTYEYQPVVQNAWNCPVANGDTLTFTVANPQGSLPKSAPVCVGSPGIQACPEQ